MGKGDVYCDGLGLDEGVRFTVGMGVAESDGEGVGVGEGHGVGIGSGRRLVSFQ